MHGQNKGEANASNIELGLRGFYLFFSGLMAADIRLWKISHRLQREKVKTKEREK